MSQDLSVSYTPQFVSLVLTGNRWGRTQALASDLGQYPTLPMVCFIKAAVPNYKKLHIGA